MTTASASVADRQPLTGFLARRPLWLFALVFVAYSVGSEIAFSWFGANGLNASFFPAAGVTMAALLLTERRQWPIVLAAAGLAEFAVDLWHGIDFAPTIGYVVANLAQPVLGAALLRVFVKWPDLGRADDLGKFLACAVVAGSALGGILGASTFVFLDGGEGWASFAAQWWTGDGLGVLVVGGAILSLRAPSVSRLTPTNIGVGIAIGGTAVATTALVFEFEQFGFVFVPLVTLALVAFRTGSRGVALTGAAMAFVAGEATAGGSVFWAILGVNPATGLIFLRVGLIVVIAGALALAAEATQREYAVSLLARSEAERSAAVELARARESELRNRIQTESLSRSAAALAEASSEQGIGTAVVSVLLDWGAAAGALHIVEGEELRPVALAGLGMDREADETFSLPGGSPTGEAVRLRAPVVVSTRDDLDRRYPGLGQGSESETWAAIPLIANGQVRAVLSLTAESQWMTEDRYRLLTTLTDQASVALERADLKQKAEASARNDALLAKLGEVLERATRLHDRASALAKLLIDEWPSLVVVHSLDEFQRLQVLARAASDGAAGRINESVLAEQARAALANDEQARTIVGATQLLTSPLRARGRAIGTLSVGFRPEAGAIASGLVDRIARRAALALDNAQLYEQERGVSHKLQVALLGGEPPAIPGTTIGTAYRPGTAMLEVGGDWYDAFGLANGRVALVVGDVVGHGLEAAIAMGQLRGAVRALAPLGSPREVLTRLDEVVEMLPDAALATIAYAELDTETGDIAYVCAGHPPPLLVPVDGQSQLLWDGRSTPLGSSLTPERVEAHFRLSPGDHFVLFTDGLVERRAHRIENRLDLLVAVTQAAGGDSSSELVDRIVNALLDEGAQDDDVCVLAVRFTPGEAPFTHAFGAAPGEVTKMRRALALWLEHTDLDAGQRNDVLLVANEAAANAAEHAYGFDGQGVVHVRAEVRNRHMEISVRDAGTWRQPPVNSNRGRGLNIIRALADDVVVSSSGSGTIVSMTIPIRTQVSS
ncbi:MAG TPA: SpoIIE family protein phosphatase [Acidimicrobiia bacterium]|nr:SpoIIE family protein phosphatase [Acidimicrobiia bacterium]